LRAQSIISLKIFSDSGQKVYRPIMSTVHIKTLAITSYIQHEYREMWLSRQIYLKEYTISHYHVHYFTAAGA